MKKLIMTICLMVLFGCVVCYAGNLNPSAPPTSGTMKTLTEVEPRIAINAENTPGDPNALYIISEPGSYYLTGNITSNFKHGILIGADDVSVDLMGYRIYSSYVGIPSGSNLDFDGIYINSELNNIEIKNGSIVSNRSQSGSFSYNGFRNGIYAELNSENIRVINVQVFKARENGIYLRNESVVENCTTNYNGTSSSELYVLGICVHDNSSISNCVSNYNGESANRVIGIGSGENCSITNCSANYNGNSAIGNVRGISVYEGSRVTGCNVIKNGQLSSGEYVYGIDGASYSEINNNIINYNGFQSSASQRIYGIYIGYGSSVKGNTINYNGSEATSTFSYIFGIYVNSACTVIGNIALYNGNNAAAEEGHSYGMKIISYCIVNENTSIGHDDDIDALSSCSLGINCDSQ